MAKYCGKCGAKLDEVTGLCPNCDADKLNNLEYQSDSSKKDDTISAVSNSQLSKKELKKQKKVAKRELKKVRKASWSFAKKVRRIFLKFILVVILLTSLAGSFIALILLDIVDAPSVKDFLYKIGTIANESSNEEFNRIDGKFTEIKVVDNDSAIKVAQDAARILKLGNAANDLSVINVSTVDDNIYYRLQQNYGGIPVYGRTMVVIAKQNGDVEAFSSNAVAISEDINDCREVNKEEVTAKVKNFFGGKDIIDDTTVVQISELTQDNCIVYTFQEFACSAYYLQVYFNSSPISFYSVIVDANTGEVLEGFSTIYENSVECYDLTKDTIVYGNYDETQKEYQLYDLNNGIMIYSYENTDSKNANSKKTFITSKNEIFGDTDAEKEIEANKGIRLLHNTGKIKNYYSKFCGDDGYALNYFCYNDTFDLGKNALGGNGIDESGQVVGYLSMGSLMGVECLDTIAHEYTHIVSRKNVNWVSVDIGSGNADESGAINEAYSDIFGELIESYIKSEPADWIHGDRIIKDPMSNGYPARVGDKKFKEYTTTDGKKGWYMKTKGSSLTDYSHGFSTIISHCAYLMNTGINGKFESLSNDDLCKIWYNTMLSVPSNCSFVILRENMEMTARFLKFNENQKACISAAFDYVGIGHQEDEETFNTSSKLSVYDRNGELYGNYVINISGKEYSGWFKWGWFKKDYINNIVVSDAIEVDISLPKGDYVINIRDSSDSALTLKKSVKIRPNSKKDKIILSSEFGKKKVGESNAEIPLDNLPDDAVEYNGHYYYLYTGGIASTYDEAAQYCNSKGGYLATLTSQEENDFVYSYILQQGVESAYFGLNDATGEGNWEWCTGEPLYYTNWHSGEPNIENSNENYALFYYKYSNGSWNDGDFTGNTVNGGNAFICEWGDYPLEEHKVSGERNIALTLDVSGSMSGTPMEETKKASSNFINTILKQDASIGIVTYDNASNIASDFSTDRETLQSIVSGLYDGGGTNIEAGLRDAQGMLEKTNAKKKIIVLMSDGEPNDGLEGEDLITYAEEIKKSGTIIYTIGFFENLFERSYAQYLMECIASDGCHYEVANADQLAFFFEDMADQINGQKYIYVRIACPVDVSVTFDGETLDSSEENLSERTSFGTLTFEENREKSDSGADDRVKVLRLKDGVDYDLKLTGTGHGIMNYTIGFMDDNGDYSDLRKFENIKITRKTQIDTVASNSDDSILNIDEDGDGKYDIRLRAEANGYGEEITTSNWIIYVIIGAVIFILLDIAVIVIYAKHKKRKGE